MILFYIIMKFSAISEEHGMKRMWAAVTLEADGVFRWVHSRDVLERTAPEWGNGEPDSVQDCVYVDWHFDKAWGMHDIMCDGKTTRVICENHQN